MRSSRPAIIALICSAMMSASFDAQAASRPPRAPRSELDKAIGTCVLTVGLGALVGGVVAGKRKRGQGVVIGAAAGGALCAVMMKVAKDKDAILAHQREAIERGGLNTATFQGKEGPVMVTTQVREATSNASANGPARVCRYADSTVIVPTGEAPLAPQLYCRDDAGDWTIAEMPRGSAAG